MSDVCRCDGYPQEENEGSEEPGTLMHKLIQTHDFHQFTHSLELKLVKKEKKKKRERQRVRERVREREREVVFERVLLIKW